MTTPDDLREAARWCREHEARVTWSEDETRCKIEVSVPDRLAGVIRGEASEYFEAYLHCRMLVEAFFDEPPTKRWFRSDV